MKRALFENCQIQPYNSGDAIDRDGFLSAVLAVKAGASGEVSVAVTHGDEKGSADAAVDDPRLFVGCTSKVEGAETDDMVIFNVDLLGCKRFVKLTVSGDGSAGGTCALALGDPVQAPVEGASPGE